ncbi:hypothetical protein HDK77DRAFT_165170 [Phyllosticta capitalensis]|uniref:Thioredoxin domain-containing protein n=1 Tax=Phyllosticta capitalensis TaxID=121624 RepID=A0ABR1YSK7_9PEZI
MTFQQEFRSWLSPEQKKTNPVPEIGSRAPSADKLSFPGAEAKPAVITFLRHCGCPFAEKTFTALRAAAAANPDVCFIAVSQSEDAATQRWIEAVGGAGAVQVVVDAERNLYAAWGLGVSSYWHVLSPGSMYSVFKLGRQEGIWNKPTESGNRWQTAGTFAVDAEGIVRWGRPAARADDFPDFEEAVRAARGSLQEKAKL